jgi:hypothetical protein
MTAPPLSPPATATGTDRASARAGAAVGVAAVVLVVAGFALAAATEATLTSPPSEVAAFYRDAPLLRTVVGGLLETTGLVLLLAFGASLTARLAAAGWPAAAARSALTAYVAICLAPGMSGGAAALWLAHTGTTDPAVLTALNTLRSLSYFLALVPFALFLACTAVAGLRTAALPRWACWAALVLAVPMVPSVAIAALGLADVLGLLGLAWVLTVAVVLLRSPDPAARP